MRNREPFKPSTSMDSPCFRAKNPTSLKKSGFSSGL
jgi:hypothetical protein